MTLTDNAIEIILKSPVWPFDWSDCENENGQIDYHTQAKANKRQDEILEDLITVNR